MDPESLPCEGGTWDSFENEQDEEQGVLQMFWPDNNAHSYSSFDDTNSNQHYVPASYQFPSSDYYGGYNLSGHNMVFSTSLSSAPMDLCISEEQSTTPSFLVGDPYRQFQQHVCLMEDSSSHEVVSESSEKPQLELPLTRHGSKTGKKRATSTSDLELPEMTRRDDGRIVCSLWKKPRAFSSVPKNVKNSQSKKAQDSFSTHDDDEEEVNADSGAQNFSSYSSEDEAKCSKSNLKPSEALKQKEKSKAGRGSATDPQSIYARKRRERINERLRTLQNLVPNGTKVDISTMLEEAVQYVKFLQLQIKLLSSDDMWMYAPIAYNGMNIGVDLMKNSPSLQN